MNVARADCVSHFADEMMTVVKEMCVKTLLVRPDVDRMLIALVIWHVLDKSVLIHARNQPHVAQMQNVLFKIILRLVFVQIT